MMKDSSQVLSFAPVRAAQSDSAEPLGIDSLHALSIKI